MMICKIKLTLILIIGLLLNSCVVDSSADENYIDIIRNDISFFENSLTYAKGQYQSTLDYEKKISVAFHPDSLGWDSLTNVKLLKLQQDLKTVVSTQSESVYQLEKIISEAKKQYINDSKQTLTNEKHLKYSWKEQKSEINNYVFQTKFAYQAVEKWKKKLYHHYHPEVDTVPSKTTLKNNPKY